MWLLNQDKYGLAENKTKKKQHKLLNPLLYNLKFQTDWLNGVSCCFQQYFSHTMVTVLIIYVFNLIRLGLWSVLPMDSPTKTTQRIQWGSNPGPLVYESNSLPLSHAGALWTSKTLQKKALENIVRQKGNARSKHCGKRRKCWSHSSKPYLNLSANLFSWNELFLSSST